MDVGGPRRAARAAINITPLIDVVLVLLIIFMVLSQTTLTELTANVPDKSDGQPREPTAQIVLRVAADRRLSIDDREVKPEALAAAMADRLRRDLEKVVFFQVDDGVAYRDVVRLMDVVKGAGARTLAVVTRD